MTITKKENISQFNYQSKLFKFEGVSPDDHIFRSIVQRGTFYEIKLLQYMYRLKSFINSKNCKNIAVDVGANIGNHSVFIGAFLADHLIAIEPNLEVIPILRQNLAANINNFTLYECAVGEKTGLGTLVLPAGSGDNVGMTQIAYGGDDVNISTLDAIFASWLKNENGSPCVSLIKIDVEGMELQVLKGAKETIIKYKPHLFVEAATKDALQEICNYLDCFGYRRLSKWGSTPVYHFAHDPSLSLVLISRCLRGLRGM